MMARKFKLFAFRIITGLVIVSVTLLHAAKPVFAEIESNVELAECTDGDDKCVDNNVNKIKEAVGDQKKVQLECEGTYGCDKMKKALEDAETENKKNNVSR